jgi:glycosyltransferase involved in cell wall biosynthesis
MGEESRRVPAERAAAGSQRALTVLFLAGEYPPRPGGVGDYTALLAEHLAAQGVQVRVLASEADAAADEADAAADEAAGGERRGAAAPTVASGAPPPGSAADPADAAPRPLSDGPGPPGGAFPGVVVWRTVPAWDWRCARIVRAAVGVARPDIVHVQYQPAAFGMEAAVSWLPGWLGRHQPGLRTATTFHDLRVPYLFPKAGPLRAAVRDRLLLGSDAAVFTERADWAAAVAPRPAGRYWIPIGSNLAAEPPAGYDRRRWRADAGVDDGTFLVVHLGFLNRSKGLETLLDAMGRLHGEGRRTRLLLVGAEAGASDPSNRAYEAEIGRRLAVLELSGLVVRLPRVAPAVASAYLLAADAAAFPFRDGASLRRGSLLAALAHGLPTVSTRRRGAHGTAAGSVEERALAAPMGAAPSGAARPAQGGRWTGGGRPTAGVDAAAVRLRDGETLLLTPTDDSAALATALARLAEDAGLRARLAAGGRALTAELTWPRIAAAHRALYADLLAGD